jgi:hypothetical protein
MMHVHVVLLSAVQSPGQQFPARWRPRCLQQAAYCCIASSHGEWCNLCQFTASGDRWVINMGADDGRTADTVWVVWAPAWYCWRHCLTFSHYGNHFNQSTVAKCTQSVTAVQLLDQLLDCCSAFKL